MDINKYIYIWINYTKHRKGTDVLKAVKVGEEITWVESIKEDTIVFDGNTFDEEFGFGGDEKERYYNGELVCLSKEFHLAITGELSTCHKQRIGTQWSIYGCKNFPSSPFLLTNNNNIRHVYNGEVNIEQTEAAREIFEFYAEDKDFTIISENMIGVIQQKNNKYYLDLFAESDFDNDEMKDEKFFFAQDGDEACIINWE